MSFFSKLGDKLFRSEFPMVGVDISDASVELLQLQAGLGRPKIKASQRFELEPDSVVNGRLNNPGPIAKLLAGVWKQSDFKTASCLLSLPDKETYFLNLETENPETEIYSLAQENLPIDLNQCVYDYLVNGSKVFFVAAPKNTIKQYLDLFAAANLKLEVIDFESACLARALADAKNLKPTFIVDLGAKATDILLIDQSGFCDQTNLASGGFFLTQKIAESLQLDFAAAEKLKQEQGIKISGLNMANLISEMLAPILAEIIEMAQRYEQQLGTKANNVVITGGTSLLQGINEQFYQGLPGFHLVKGDLGKGFDLNGQALGDNSILYANVIGLALRGLDSVSLKQGVNLLKNYKD